MLRLEVEVDHTSGVHDEVGGVQDATGREAVGARPVGERVVRRAADGARREGVDDLVVEHAADAGGHEQIRRNQVLGAGLGPLGAEIGRERALGRVDVGDRQSGAFGGEAHREPPADLAETRDRDAAAVDVGRPGHSLERRAQRLVDAEARRAGRFARAARRIGKPHDVRGAFADGQHVVGGRADVFRRAVEPVEPLHRVAEVEEGRAAPVGVERRAGRQADDGLAAAGIEPRGGVLQGHRGRQAERVADGVAPVRVGPQPGAAEGGPEGRGVQRDGDDEAAARARGHLHAFVGEIGQGQGVRHRVLFRLALWAVLGERRGVAASSAIVPPGRCGLGWGGRWGAGWGRVVRWGSGFGGQVGGGDENLLAGAEVRSCRSPARHRAHSAGVQRVLPNRPISGNVHRSVDRGPRVPPAGLR